MQLSVTLCTKLVDGDVSVGKNLSRLPSKDLLLGRNPTLPWGHVCFFVAVFFHHVTAQWTGSQALHVNSASIRYCRTTVAQNIQLAWEQRECDFTVERNSVSCLMRTAHAGFLSDTIHCPTVTSKPVCRMTVGQNIQLLWEQTDHDFTVLCLMGVALTRFLSHTTVGR